MLAHPLPLLRSVADDDPSAADVRAARAGDVAAFERLYRAHVGRVYALCLRLVADRVRAEQLTQDAFVRAWERLGTFRGESPFDAWMRTLAVHVVFADRRATARRIQRVTTTDDEAVLDAAPSPGTGRGGDRIDLERAIAALPDGARTVFVLHDVAAAAAYVVVMQAPRGTGGSGDVEHASVASVASVAPAPPASVPVMPPRALVPEEDSYGAALGALRPTFEARRRQLRDDDMKRIDVSLHAIEAALATTRAALESHPDDPDLRAELGAEYEQKIQTMNDVLDWTTRS
jgi:RNA polymerase sigma-70 factor (ECF subfamily)